MGVEAAGEIGVGAGGGISVVGVDAAVGAAAAQIAVGVAVCARAVVGIGVVLGAPGALSVLLGCVVVPATTGTGVVLPPVGVNCLNPPGATGAEEVRLCRNKPGEMIGARGGRDAAALNPGRGENGCLVTVAAWTPTLSG